MIGIDDISNSRWFKHSIKVIRKLLYSDSFVRESKYHRHILWNMGRSPSEEDLEPISYFLAQNEIFLEEPRRDIFNFFHKPSSGKRNPIHIKVKREASGFRINAHIDLVPHEEVYYTKLTSKILSELSCLIQRINNNAKVALISFPYTEPIEKEIQKEKAIEKERFSIRSRIGSYINLISNEIIERGISQSIEEKEKVSQEFIELLIQDQVNNRFEYISQDNIFKKELHSLIARKIGEIMECINIRYEEALQVSKELKEIDLPQESENEISQQLIHADNKTSNSLEPAEAPLIKEEHVKKEKKSRDLKRLQRQREEDLKRIEEEEKVGKWEHLIIEKYKEVLEETYEEFRVRNATALNINSILNEVERRLTEGAPSERKYISRACSEFDLKKVESLFNDTKRRLEEVVYEQRERKKHEKLEFDNFLTRFCREQFDKLYEESINKTQYRAKPERRQIKEKLKSMFDVQFNQNQEFNYTDMHNNSFHTYLKSAEFKKDFQTLNRRIKSYNKNRMYEEKVRKQGISEELRINLLFILYVIAIIILIILILIVTSS